MRALCLILALVALMPQARAQPLPPDQAVRRAKLVDRGPQGLPANAAKLDHKAPQVRPVRRDHPAPRAIRVRRPRSASSPAPTTGTAQTTRSWFHLCARPARVMRPIPSSGEALPVIGCGSRASGARGLLRGRPNFPVLVVHRVVPAKLATRKSDGFILSGKRSHWLAARAHDPSCPRQ
jgi:hypothetical protein